MRLFSRSCLGLLTLATPLVAQDAPKEEKEAPRELRDWTDTRRSATNLNVETIRGLAHDATSGALFALNTHGSQLLRFDGAASAPAGGGAIAPQAIFRTLNNPCALALWEDADEREYAIVVGGSTHGVALQDRNTGEIVSYIGWPSEAITADPDPSDAPDPSEPMDIVVDVERKRAFVSCAGAYDVATPSGVRSGGAVVEIDLENFDPSAVVVHFIDAARPTFLSFAQNGPGPLDNEVYVAPFLSGNQTTFALDGYADGTVATMAELPDDDLFAIDAQGNVSAKYQGLGTLLTAHGVNPFDETLWMAGVDLFNANASTEPEHRGDFANNRLVIVNDPPGGPLTVDPVDLDTVGFPSQPASADKPASFPFGLAFHSSGHAFVSGSTSDVVRELDADGNTVRSVGLPEGAIPRSLLIDAAETYLYVQAWGTNQVLRYELASWMSSPSAAVSATAFDLGPDPQPLAVQRGRELWYDADNSAVPGGSMIAKVSCNTCHPRGAADGLAWELGEPPLDRKDLMVTQSLLSIEDTFPYHWRGERSLAEFNVAFPGLLGGVALDDDPAAGEPNELEDFEAFVFSLQAPANPRQHIDRILTDDRAIVVADDGQGGELVGRATHGQLHFHEVDGAALGFSPGKCVDCHSAESGTNGLITTDLQTRYTQNANLDVAHLRQLTQRFFQPQIEGYVDGVLTERPRGGFGFSQDGDERTIFEFFQPAVFFVGQPNQDQLRVDTGSFMAQFDQGIAPRAHFALKIDAQRPDVQDEMSKLVSQAQQGWVDVAAIATLHNQGDAQIGFWLRVPQGGGAPTFFYAEDWLVPEVTPSALVADAEAGNLSLLVLGLPPGNAFRFAVDPDGDGLSNLAEFLLSLDPNDADGDGDGLPDGYEVQPSHSPALDPQMPNTAAEAALADDVPPALVASGTELEHVTGRIAKFFVEFSEPVRWVLEVQAFDEPTQTWVTHGELQPQPAFRTRDTVVAQGMEPGVGGFATRVNEYRILLHLEDYGGEEATVQLDSDSANQLVQTRTNVFATNRPALVPSLFELDTNGTTVNTIIDVDDVWHGAVDSMGQPTGTGVQDKVVVVQLVRADALSPTGWSPVPIQQLSPQGSTRLEDELSFAPSLVGPVTYGTPQSLVDGPFLVSEPTSQDGFAQLKFDVDPSLTSGEELQLVLLGILEEIPAEIVLPPGVDWEYVGFSKRYWQLPMTPASRRSLEVNF